MKQISFLALAFIIALSISGCKKSTTPACQNSSVYDPASGTCVCNSGTTGQLCQTSLCQNGGTLTNGTCGCPPGYSGVYCQTYDSCYGVTCHNGGTCSNGSCNCPQGYEGKYCDSISRTKFIGTFAGTVTTDQANPFSPVYIPASSPVTITAGTSSVYSINITIGSATLFGNVTGNAFAIPYQPLSGYNFDGYCSYDPVNHILTMSVLNVPNSNAASYYALANFNLIKQ